MSSLIAAGIFGFMLAVVGFRFTDWQFWVLLLSAALWAGLSRV